MDLGGRRERWGAGEASAQPDQLWLTDRSDHPPLHSAEAAPEAPLPSVSGGLASGTRTYYYTGVFGVTPPMASTEGVAGSVSAEGTG